MKVGIIGCGAIATRAHIPAFRRAGAEIVALSDIDMTRATGVAKRFNIAHVYSDYRELLAGDAELVSVCTPPRTHATISVDAAKEGKQILLEKPMATNLNEADSIIRACESNKVKLCMMHEYRFYPCVRQAKQRISRGRVGQVLAAQITVHPQFPLKWSDSTYFYEGWGMLEEIGVHYLDILSYITEARPRRVWVAARDATEKMGFFNYIQTMIELSNSCVAYLDLSWVGGSFEATAKFFGTAGKIDLDIRNDYISESHGFLTPLDEMNDTLRKSWHTLGRILSKEAFKGPTVYHDTVIRSFMESISQNGEPPVGAEEGRKSVELLQLIKQAAQ